MYTEPVGENKASGSLSVGSFQAVQFSGLYKSEEMLFVKAAEKMEKK